MEVHRFSPNDIVQLVYSGERGTILQTNMNGLNMYSLKMESGNERLVSYDDIVPEGHRLVSQVEKWKAEGKERGFSSIIIGVTDKAWKCFYGNTPDDYKKIVRANPHIKFKYFWRID
jgi:hypothetical protein